MCELCEPIKQKIEVFEKWVATNPYKGDEQVQWEGIDFILYPNGTFVIGAVYDGGYIGDEVSLNFKFCPLCGKKF